MVFFSYELISLSAIIFLQSNSDPAEAEAVELAVICCPSSIKRMQRGPTRYSSMVNSVVVEV